MSFQTSAESLRAKAHLTDVPTTALVGAAVLLVVCVASACLTFLSCSSTPAFEVVTAAEADDGSDAAPGGTGGIVRSSASEANAELSAEKEPAALIQVHVAGAVQKPGVYVLSEGDRVNDAVMKAEGFADDACGDAVNLARPLVDGEQIYVPTVEEVSQGETAGIAADADATGSPMGGNTTSALVNINTADASQLEQLPGVGPSTAAAIIHERETNGLFAAPEDLMRVTGIGEKKFEKVRDLICV